jgi:hypothetical protein
MKFIVKGKFIAEYEISIGIEASSVEDVNNQLKRLYEKEIGENFIYESIILKKPSKYNIEAVNIDQIGKE